VDDVIDSSIKVLLRTSLKGSGISQTKEMLLEKVIKIDEFIKTNEGVQIYPDIDKQIKLII
jgi:hypothetical protein